MPDPTSADQPAVVPAPTPDGDVAGLRDALARAEALAASLIDASADCVKRLNLDAKLVWISDTGRKHLGLPAAPAGIGESWLGWWPDVERAKAERALADARGGRTVRFEGWASTRTGNARCWSVTVSPIRDAAGRTVELLASSRDVTQLRAEQAIAAVHRPPAEPPRRPADVNGAPPGGSLHYAVVGSDLDGVVRTWNDAAAALFGWPADEIVGQVNDVLFTPEDREAGVPAMERATAARDGIARDRRWHQRRDGGRVFVDGAMLARRDADGRVGGFVKIGRDDTAHRRVREELDAVRRRLDSALIAGEVGTYEWEIGDDRVRGDANFRRIFGLPDDAPAELPVREFLDAIHPDDRPATAALIEEALAAGTRFETEYRIVAGPGPERWVIARGRIERDADGRPVRWAGVVLDVSDRRRAEAERQAIAADREAQARIYETILSTTDDFAYIFDLQGRVLYANRRLLEVWGRTFDEAVGLSMIELGYPVWHAAMHLKEIDEVIRTKRPIQGEVPFTGASGIGGIYEYVFSPVIGPGGDVECIVGTTRDVTARRQGEDAMRLTQSRDRFFADLGEATRDLDDPADVVLAVATRLGEYLGTSRCAYADVEADGDRFTIHRDFCDVGMASSAGDYSLDDFGRFAATTLRASRTLVIRDVGRELAEVDPQGRDTFAAIDIAAIICCPLVRAGRLVAMMAVHQRTPREWTADDVSLVEATVERAWAYLERARTVRALADSEGRFRQLADSMPQIVFGAGPDGTVDYFNRRWYEFTGLAQESDLGFEYWRHVHDPRHLPHVAEVWARAVRDGSPYECEYPLRRHDGMWRWHLARALPTRGTDGRVVRWYGTNTDIHDQKVAEAALAAEKAVLERIASGAPLNETLDVLARGVESQSADGMLCSILVVDPADARRLRSASAPSLPADYNRLVDGLEVAAASGSCGTAAHTRGLVIVDDIATDPRWAAFRDVALGFGLRACSSMPILRADGGVAGTIAVYYREAKCATERDLDLLRTAGHLAGIAIERAQAEQTVRAALDSERAARAESDRARSESEHAGRMKDEFLATLSHELRTPLSAILGWSQMLRREGTRPEALRQGLETIERNARAQTQIIEDLLDMSRIISGKVVLDTGRLDLATVVRAAVETVRPTAMAKGVAIELDGLEGGPPAPVVGDANRLQQVFWNLLTNAVKFTPRGGEVRVRLDRRHSQWRVDVSDTGEGIRPDFLPFVFDRFRQADASTTRRHGGLGLGLAIVKQIAELHGGRVSVESAGEGRGATFTVRLPMSVLHLSADAAWDPAAAGRSAGEVAVVAGIDRPESLALARAAQADARLAGSRVLVVDDEPDARAMVRHLLESCGATVAEAADAEEGIRLTGEFRPDVLVSDVGMPGESGHQMLARIRALGPAGGGEVPAIALTAYARADDRVRAIRAGFQMHVPKPVEPAELIETVASLLSRRG